jgi:hypothetical protein
MAAIQQALEVGVICPFNVDGVQQSRKQDLGVTKRQSSGAELSNRIPSSISLKGMSFFPSVFCCDVLQRTQHA